jgi:syntaxin 1B/2/3
LNHSAACSSGNASNRERKGTDGPPPVPRDLESAILQSAPLLDDFMSAQEGVQGGCERIERFISEIDQLHRTALVTVSPDESHELAKRIEASSVLASAEATTVRRLLKSMDGESKNLGLELSPSDLRLRVSKQRALCKRFMALMERFESMQLLHRNKYRQQMERQFKLVKPEATEAELLELRDSPQAMTQQVNQCVLYVVLY